MKGYTLSDSIYMNSFYFCMYFREGERVAEGGEQRESENLKQTPY